MAAKTLFFGTDIEKRGRELLALLITASGCLIFLSLVSYTPNDPGPFHATDAPAQNIIGEKGAFLASLAFEWLGWGAWWLFALPFLWGLWLMLDAARPYILWRLLIAPLIIPLSSVLVMIVRSTPQNAATLNPNTIDPAGGIVGNAVVYSLALSEQLATLSNHQQIALVVVISSVFMAIGLFISGITHIEIKAIARIALWILIFIYDKLALCTLFLLRQSKRTLHWLYTRIAIAIRNKTHTHNTDTAARTSAPVADTPPQPSLLKRIVAFVQSYRFFRNKTDWSDNAEPALHTPTDHNAFTDDDTFLEFIENKDCALPTTVRIPIVAEPDDVWGHRFQQGQHHNSPTISYTYPSLDLLKPTNTLEQKHPSENTLRAQAQKLQNVLEEYGIKGTIDTISLGPVVTMYELHPAPGLKASRVIGLASDIARSMAALSARISVIPERSIIGIELPNKHREIVLLRDVLETKAFQQGAWELPLALGKDILGETFIADLVRMPHLLVAGTTGSGKSVAINTMILSLLYRLSPEQCRFIMIDPKQLELSVYNNIPHLLTPVVTHPKKAIHVLKWAINEMEKRNQRMAKINVRNVQEYNNRMYQAIESGDTIEHKIQIGFDPDTYEPVFETEIIEPVILPYIVIIVDEVADLMMVAGKEIDQCIQRLAQKARASGIHLIMATQRPSVNVITGVIKANFPARVSFQVASKIDSRTILGEQGAEQLLGMGDMLYREGGGKLTRVHSPFVSDREVEVITNDLKQNPPAEPVGVLQNFNTITQAEDACTDFDNDDLWEQSNNEHDPLYDKAVAIVSHDRKCSTSYIQRKLNIGYNKAARLVEQMENNGLITAANHVGKRDILIPKS